MTDIRTMTIDELTEYVISLGDKSFRAKQIYEWLHKKNIMSLDEMTNVPASLRDKISTSGDFASIAVQNELISKIDDTRKYLFALCDGNIIESVFMRYKHGNSVCISSQVGCRMGCRFCASTIDGVERNLTAGEMCAQIYAIEKTVGEKVSNIVVMGSGEPMDNFENITRFVELISDEKGHNLSQRNITVSTCGIVPKMKELADRKYQITLALSLHASNQDKRKELMPIANKYDIHEVIEACDYYFEKTGRRISYEYSLIAGVNDTENDANELAGLLRGKNCHINLIPVNPIKERDFKRSEKGAVYTFQKRLESKDLTATVRREMGSDINGACGQLRRSQLNK